MSERQAILAQLYRRDYPAGACDFDTLLVDVAEAALSLTRIDAEALANPRACSRHWNHLLERLDEDERRGLSPLFAVPDRLSRMVVWTPFAAAAGASRAGRVVRRRAAILRRIDSLDSRQYEALACVVCTGLGATRVHLTPPGDEGGIDFLAEIRLRRDCHLFSTSGGGLRIVGQSKKWNSKPELGDVQKLLQALDDVRHREPSLQDIVPDWFYKCSGPIAGWMVAHEGFQSGAVSRAQQHGVLLSDSLDFAELLSASRTFQRARPGSDSDCLMALIDKTITAFA